MKKRDSSPSLKGHKEVLSSSLRFRSLAKVTVALPFSALVFVVLYSFFFDLKRTTHTHCKVWNFAPSISSAIGVFRPQKYVWKLLLSLQAAPRFLIAWMYYNHFISRTRFAQDSWLIQSSFFANVLENLALLGLSFIPSKEDFAVHKFCFIAFLLCSTVYMALSYRAAYLYSRSPGELKALHLKKRAISVNFGGILLALYFYYRHNRYCEPGIYSLFSIAEYGIVISNMAYHFTSYYDFYDKVISIV